MTPLQIVQIKAQSVLSDFAGNFKPGAKLTLIVRRPGEPEQDFVSTNDDNFDEVIKVMERTKTRDRG